MHVSRRAARSPLPRERRQGRAARPEPGDLQDRSGQRRAARHRSAGRRGGLRRALPGAQHRRRLLRQHADGGRPGDGPALVRGRLPAVDPAAQAARFTALALDEFGKASAWLQGYGGRPGTGLLQLAVSRQDFADLSECRRRSSTASAGSGATGPQPFASASGGATPITASGKPVAICRHDADQEHRQEHQADERQHAADDLRRARCRARCS